MRTVLLVAAALCGARALCGAGASPCIKWTFDEVDAKGHALNVAPGAKGEYLQVTELRAGVGIGGSTACRIFKSPNITQRAYVRALDYDAFTFDLSFKLDGPVDAKEGNGLVSYSWNSWARGNLLLMLTPKEELQVTMQRPATKEGACDKVDFRLVSRPVSVSDGAYHAVRMVRDAGGTMTLYLDGVKVASASGAPSLKDIRTKSPEWYPLIRLGVDDRSGAPRRWLNGFMDDVAIYDIALGAPEIELPKEDYSRVAAVEFRAVEQDVRGVLLSGGSGRVTTPKFDILEREEGGLGNWVRAEDKFVEAAATATLEMDSKSIRVVFSCPVPKGMEVKKASDSVWRGDLVEFFIKPNPAKTGYFQYAVNAAGQQAAYHYLDVGVPDASFKSGMRPSVRQVAGGFEVRLEIPRKEVFAEMPSAGDEFTANFVREGATCGGLSSWIKVGAALHQPAKFGKIIWGGGGDYFSKRLRAARSEIDALVTPAAKAAGEKAYEPLAAAVSKHGANIGAFTALERMFANFNQAVVAISMAGRPLVVYDPATPWGDRVEPTLDSKMLKGIHMVAARNSRTWRPIAVRNMSERDFIGQVKVFDTAPRYSFGFEDTCGAARHFTIYEAIAKDLGTGNFVHDPFAQLPMNSLLRLCAGHTTVLWLELDTHGLAPGRHSAVLVVKKATGGFETLTFPMTIDVKDADLDSVDCRRAAYTAIGGRALRNVKGARVAAARRLHAIEWTYTKDTVYLSPWRGFWSKFDKSGKYVDPDYSHIDRLIEAKIEAGGCREKMLVWMFFGLENGIGEKFASPAYDKKLTTAVGRLQTHLKERWGLGKDRLIVYTFDEPNAMDSVEDPAYKSKMSKTYYVGKLLKAADPETVTFTNPHAFGQYGDAKFAEKFGKMLERLAECYDIMEFYRPRLTPEIIAKAKSLPFKEIWTYSILGTSVSPAVYCGDQWKNLRDGFDGCSTFWHLDESAGRDGFDGSDNSSAGSKNFCDYGSIYIDYDNGYALTSRRETAHDLGYEDQRLVKFLRKRFAGDKARLSAIEGIVKAAADACTMEAFERARLALLDMIDASPK